MQRNGTYEVGVELILAAVIFPAAVVNLSVSSRETLTLEIISLAPPLHIAFTAMAPVPDDGPAPAAAAPKPSSWKILGTVPTSLTKS